MSEDNGSGAFDAGNAVRLAAAMREKADAQRGADSARAALEAAEARLQEAEREVGELKSGVTFEDLLDLVASLSLRVAELESGGARPEPAARAASAPQDSAPSGAAPSSVPASPEGGAGGQSEWEAAAPSTQAPAPAPMAPHGGQAPVNPPAPDGADPFDEDGSHEGRRAPNRPVLYMNAYARGYAEAQDGLPENIQGTRGWEFKGYRDGRQHAAASLDFDPLGAFAQEMKACRTPIEPKVREQARKLSLILVNGHATRGGGDPRGDAGHGAAMSEEGVGGEDDSDDSVVIPGFLQRPGQRAGAD